MPRFLLILVFCGGVVSLGAEIAAARLLAPYFGTSLVVWSSLIGLILVALSLGYWLGGKWADRSPRLDTLLKALLAAGALLSLVPLVSAPVLSAALIDLGHLRWGMLIGSFAGVLVLLGAPMLLLGCVTPFAVRLATQDVGSSGRTAGRLFALSTLGSFLGAFLPSVFLIPVLGTRWTFTSFGLLLLVLSAAGFARCRAYRWAAAACAAALLSAGAGAWMSGRPIKPGPGLVFETESPYQYVRVVERKNGWRWLQLNEGLVVHSKFHPGKLLSNGEWDYFALAPLFTRSGTDLEAASRRWALIGAGAGTTARLVSAFWPAASIRGVELDPAVVDAGERFFSSRDTSGYTVEVDDGRAWLATHPETFDVIGVDAYRQPYIPFELTTVEFFGTVRDHLGPAGVAAINVSRPPGDLRLVNALATTMAQVFPSVFLIHLPRTSLATIVVGTVQPVTLDDVRQNAARVPTPARPLARMALPLVTDRFDHTLVLTDDRAPVERLVDLMLAQQALNWDPATPLP